jgi:hypothetical protein
MPSLDSTLSSLVQPLYSVLPCQAPTTSCQASVRLGQALLIPRQILPTSSQLLYWYKPAHLSMPRQGSLACRVGAASQARQSNLCRVNAASRSRYSRVKPHPCRVTAASDLVSAASHCTGRVKRHPERQPQLLWSKEELVSGNRKSIYTMPFVSDLGYGVHLF